VKEIEVEGMLKDGNHPLIGPLHPMNGLGPEDGKDSLLSKWNDGGIFPPPQGTNFKRIEELSTPKLIFLVII
jgi:hypothetical protein